MAKFTVALIDDAFFIRNLIKKGIARKPESNGNTFEVIGEAQDGRAGIDLCETLKPDIVTIDFNIPTINGLDFVKYLKELHPEIVMIMISSNLDPEFAKKVKDANCRLLTKPFQEAYLWKALDDAAIEILNTDRSVLKPKVDIEAQKILAELAEEINGEIVPLKDERKEISAQGLADKNIGQEKAKNIGFDYSGNVLEVKTEQRRMSSEMISDIQQKTPIISPLSFSEVDDNVNLEDEDDFLIDLDAIENQRESEYGKTGIDEIEDEFFFFDDDEEKQEPVKEINPTLVAAIDLSKGKDDFEDEIILIHDENEPDEQLNTKENSAFSQKCTELLNTVTFNYYDYLGSLLYRVQNSVRQQQKYEKKEAIVVQIEKKPVREETVDEEFDRLFNEFNGGQDLEFDNPNIESSNVPDKNETVLIRNREHVTIDPPKDNNILKIYGSKLENVTSAETFNALKDEPETTTESPKKKGLLARFFDKIFKRG